MLKNRVVLHWPLPRHCIISAIAGNSCYAAALKPRTDLLSPGVSNPVYFISGLCAIAFDDRPNALFSAAIAQRSRAYGQLCGANRAEKTNGERACQRGTMLLS
jgi:hypothetical protein